jgi:hypothetical protein
MKNLSDLLGELELYVIRAGTGIDARALTVVDDLWASIYDHGAEKPREEIAA